MLTLKITQYKNYNKRQKQIYNIYLFYYNMYLKWNLI